jgi:methionyl-tRNA formyltransferase
MRVAFAGTPQFARVALAGLHAAGFTIPMVLTQPDRSAGRGMQLRASAVKDFALDHAIPVVQPRSLRLDGKYPGDAAAAAAALQGAKADVLVVAAYGLILPQWVLDIPRLGCLNIHASLLPRWRGAAPVQRAIEAGDTRTGVTIMQMDAGLDTGAMLLSQEVEITPHDTTGTLQERLADLGAALIVQAVELAAGARLEPRPQPLEGVTYAHKIEKSEAAIDWGESAIAIERRIRAFDPFPGASSTLEGEVVKIWRATVLPGSGTPGQVLGAGEDGIAVACGAGVLRITELQRPGGRRVSARQFLQGTRLVAGMKFAPRQR